MRSLAAALRSPRLLAGAAIVVAYVVDALVKRLMLAEVLHWNNTVLVPGLLDLHYAHNRGISFSLFWQADNFGSAMLAGLLLVVTIGFAIAAFRTPRPLAAAGLGLIVGGALGNMADRYADGAVFDFLVLRLGAVPLFVFNTADLFISIGVALVLADALFSDTAKPRST